MEGSNNMLDMENDTLLSEINVSGERDEPSHPSSDFGLEHDAIDVIIYDNVHHKIPRDSNHFLTGRVTMTDLDMFKSGLRSIISRENNVEAAAVCIEEVYHYDGEEDPRLVTQESDLNLALLSYQATVEKLKYGIVWTQDIKKSEAEPDMEKSYDVHPGRDEIDTLDLNKNLSEPQNNNIFIKEEPEDDHFSSEIPLQMASHNFLSSINDLWIRDICCDLDLICQGQKIVKAHRVILAAGSLYFQDPCSFSDHGRIYHFDDTPVDVVRLVVEFLYGNTVNLNQKNAKEVLELSKKFAITTLVNVCSDILSIRLDQDNSYDQDNGDSEKKSTQEKTEQEVEATVDLQSNSETMTTRKRKVSSVGRKMRKTFKKCEAKKQKLSKKYECTICQETFDLQKQLKCHRFQSHGESHLIGQFECSTCQERFKEKKDLRNHKLEAHGDGALVGHGSAAFCEYCMMSIGGRDILLHKIRKHHIGLQFKTEVKCDRCHAYFTFKEEFKMHMKQEHKSLIEYCEEDECDEIFELSDISAVNNHATQNHGKTTLTCQFCEYETPFYKSLWGHSVKVHRKVICTLCKQEYGLRDWKKILSHVYKKHNIIPERTELKMCQHCGFQTYQGNILLQHIRTSHNSSPVNCDVCGKLFKHQHSLYQHYQWCGKKKMFMCSYCGKQFNQKIGLRKHERLDHEGGFRNMQCPQCPFSTDYASNLESHMFHKHRVVPSDRPVFTCEFCGYQTLDKYYLEKHIRNYHTGERKKLICKFCGIALAESSMKGHVTRMHEKPELKPFLCFYLDCSYSARFRGNLCQHLLSSHLMPGEKPFQCSHCPYRSGVRENVTKHIQIQHLGKDSLVQQLWEPPTRNDVTLYLTSRKEYDSRSLEEFISDVMEKKKKNVPVLQGRNDESQMNP